MRTGQDAPRRSPPARCPAWRIGAICDGSLASAQEPKPRLETVKQLPGTRWSSMNRNCTQGAWRGLSAWEAGEPTVRWCFQVQRWLFEGPGWWLFRRPGPVEGPSS